MSRHWNPEHLHAALSRYGIEAGPAALEGTLSLLPNTPRTVAGLKRQARALPEFLRVMVDCKLKHTKALEVVARLHGFANWAAALRTLPAAIPPYCPQTGWATRVPAGHAPFDEPFAFLTLPPARSDIPQAMFGAFEDYFRRRRPPVGWARAALEGRLEEAQRLAGAHARHLPALLAHARHFTDRRSFGSPGAVAAHLVLPSTAVPVGGLNSGAVIAALYNAAEPVAHGYRSFDLRPMTVAEGADAYEGYRKPYAPDSDMRWVDYVRYTRMKLHFYGTGWLDVKHYETDRLPGVAAYAVDVLRESEQGPADPRLRAVRHHVLAHNARRSDIHLDTPMDDPTLTDTGRELLALLRRTAAAAPGVTRPS